MEKETTLNEVLFIGLILNLQASAMIALGKIANPVSQKIERNLDQARMTIDMLGMLEERTKGNCTDEETKTLQKALTELRMNYLDELKKDHAKLEKEEAEKEAGKEPGEAGSKGPEVSEPDEAKDEESGETKPPVEAEEPAGTEDSIPDKEAAAEEKKLSKGKGQAAKKGGKKARARKTKADTK